MSNKKTTPNGKRSAPAPCPAPCSAWDSWSAADLEREIKSRMTYFYGQTDGTMDFPDSAEGDLLKIVHAFLKQNAKLNRRP